MNAGALWRRYVRPRLRGQRWLLIGALWVLAVVLGYLGFRAKLSASGQTSSFWDTFYLSLQLFPLQSGAVQPPVPWELGVARLLAPAVLAATAVGAMLAVLGEQLQLWSVRRLRDHVVVCGLGERGLLLAKAFAADHPVVAIENDEEARGIGEAREEGVVVLIGDATDRTLLRKARADRARYLVAVGGEDGTNAEIAVDARWLVEAHPGSELDAFVHVVDERLCRLLREHQAASAGSGSYHLRFFNVFEAGARAWLAEYPPFDARSGLGHSPPHLVVVGVGQMGRSLVLGAARSWLTLHPESALRPTSAFRPRITLVDRAAEAKRESLLARHPKLGEFCDLVACQLDITAPEFEEAAFLLDADGRCSVTSVYVCLDDDSAGLSAALTMARRVGRDPTPVPVVVRMRQASGLASLVGSRSEGVENLHAFALLDHTCTPQLMLGVTQSEIVARAIHEEYVRRARAAGETPEKNPSMVAWDRLPEDLKESNRRQADHIGVKLQAVGCDTALPTDAQAPLVALSPEEIERLAEMEHERWTAERLFEGWTYAPPPKDIVKKTSPDLVSWHELPEEEKEKDRAAARALPALLQQAGFRVYRLDESASAERRDDDGNRG